MHRWLLLVLAASLTLISASSRINEPKFDWKTQLSSISSSSDSSDDSADSIEEFFMRKRELAARTIVPFHEKKEMLMPTKNVKLSIDLDAVKQAEREEMESDCESECSTCFRTISTHRSNSPKSPKFPKSPELIRGRNQKTKLLNFHGARRNQDYISSSSSSSSC
jgi:hypothetical protein